MSSGVNLKLFTATEQKLRMEKARTPTIESGQNCCVTCQYFNWSATSCDWIDNSLKGRVVEPSGTALSTRDSLEI